MTATDFTASRGVNYGTFIWWRCKLRRLDQQRGQVTAAPVFTEVVLQSPSPSPSPQLTLMLDGFRAHLVIDDATDLARLRRMLEVVA